MGYCIPEILKLQICDIMNIVTFANFLKLCSKLFNHLGSNNSECLFQ